MYAWLTPRQAELADARIGVLRLFSPANPTGRYCLQLGHQTHYMVAVRLMELYQQQVRIRTAHDASWSS